MEPKNLRKEILKISAESGACHIGSALSIVEILLAIKKVQKDNYFVFSKASGASALYVLEGKSAKYLKENPLCYPGGSLSHGESIACGMALGDRTKKVYCLCSDGEINEGSFWEAILFASSRKLNNLYFIIDRNMIQALDFTENVLKLEPLTDKFKAFGWEVRIVKDGHNQKEIEKALTYPSLYKDKPIVIIANTIKGKGVSFMENCIAWHYLNLTSKLLKKALKELDER